jgi:hypothetical protein
MVEVYLYSPTRLHGVVLNELSPRISLYVCLHPMLFPKQCVHLLRSQEHDHLIDTGDIDDAKSFSKTKARGNTKTVEGAAWEYVSKMWRACAEKLSSFQMLMSVDRGTR